MQKPTFCPSCKNHTSGIDDTFPRLQSICCVLHFKFCHQGSQPCHFYGECSSALSSLKFHLTCWGKAGALIQLSIPIKMPGLSKLKLVLVWKMVVPETEPGRAGRVQLTLVHRSSRQLGPSLGLESQPPPPLIDLRHICLMPSGRVESVSSTEIPPAGSRPGSVCCNRKSFHDSRETRRHLGQRRNGWAPHVDSVLIGGQSMLP